ARAHVHRAEGELASLRGGDPVGEAGAAARGDLQRDRLGLGGELFGDVVFELEVPGAPARVDDVELDLVADADAEARGDDAADFEQGAPGDRVVEEREGEE